MSHYVIIKLCRRLHAACRDVATTVLQRDPRHSFLHTCQHRLTNMISHLPIHLPGKPDEGLGYCISHYLGVASFAMLLAGLGLGLYTRWWETGDAAIFVVALFGAFIFSLNVVLCYYFSFQRVSAYISHLWFGGLLGIVAFYQWKTPITTTTTISSGNNNNNIDNNSVSRRPEGRFVFFDDFTTNVLLMVSLLLQANWTLFARGTRRSTASSAFLKTSEMLEVVGMALAGFFHRNNNWQIVLLTSAFALGLGLLRIKSSYGLVNLFLVFFLGVFFVLPSLFSDAADTSGFHWPSSSSSAINVYALACFCGRHLVEPLIDVYFNALLPMERWSWLLYRHSLVRKLTLLGCLVAQMAYCAYLGTRIPRHASFLIMTPIYAAFGFVYFAYHLIVFLTCWCLANKITECLSALDAFSKTGSSSAATAAISLSRVMASRGVRHMCLIARRLAFIATFMTIILSLVGWKVKNGLSIAAFLNVLPVDALILALVVDLSACLGGTCAGFALVVPTSPVAAGSSTHSDGVSADLFPALLPPRTIEIISERATKTLNSIQRFFAVHLIVNCGSEYSSSGLSGESLLGKLKKFFAKKTPTSTSGADSLPFDTYILYYSGPSHASGDWAMSDNGVATLQSILDAWKEATLEEADDQVEDHVGGDESEAMLKSSATGNGRRRQSRLILIIDSEHAHKWTKALSRTRDVFVALQTFYPRDPRATKDRHDSDPEDVSTPLHGEFTQGFTRFNPGGGGCGESDAEMGSRDAEKGETTDSSIEIDGISPTNDDCAWFVDFTRNGIRPVYAVSRPWTDFSFKMPSAAEFDQFSSSHFPRLLLPVLRFSALPFVYLSSLCCCVEAAWKMVRRCKISWFPPAVLNVGHDFKLMRG